MVTFYHRFICQAAHVMRPLYGALKDKSPSQAVDWTAEREKAFEATKAALSEAAVQSTAWLGDLSLRAPYSGRMR